ncbi:DHS-like NAD/FAD-binding domain-containing protein [Wallemia mellicola]|uniref:DHS-like NAD/FAD-binding domain-containing protein n=1 Tax=Wallemia mellicola TaxID=1708541 RepID=A0AB74KK07_9BASI|nr:hypothetical protein E3Q24_01798 [Wallemia mellicola]TIB86118.1 DHS-like NAD/FAD-binding domain-containing protein [Wallemia mellicola]TIB89295.1 DHS-like NAD/FAD-binding domain-containing protein [Wallemia mellicola]TIC24208.1 DHS-like NAD/FAD-binding domain-containing protein [Wallemia mellicola]TIC41184.1 DHS-like NAD/FAD-binding domain-containing protein [Wallemia mellicola]
MQTISLNQPTIEHKKALEALNSKIIKSKRIIIVSGAGISCSSGIPDFRSPEGLYALVKDKFDGKIGKGQDLFDAQLFRNPSTTALFYSFIAQLKLASDNAAPSPTHKFLKTLEIKGRLLHSYTQNIDGLEQRVGLKNLVNLHGSLNEVRCASCSFVGEMSNDYLNVFANGQSPKCPQCASRANERNTRGKRPLAVGCLRPGIVLYNENHWSGDSIAKAQTADSKKKPDLLIVMGTSLKVHGLKQLVKGFARTIHQNNLDINEKSRKMPGNVVFVNATPAAGKEWSSDLDYFVHGTSDDFVNRLVNQWKATRPQDWQVQTKITQTHNVAKSIKPATAKKTLPPSGDSNEDSKTSDGPSEPVIDENQISTGFDSQQQRSCHQPEQHKESPMKSLQEINSLDTLQVSPKSRKRNTVTSSTIKRSVSSTQKSSMDVSILKKNKSEDFAINFDLKIGDGSETEPEEDTVETQPTNLSPVVFEPARRSIRIRNHFTTVTATA